MSTKPIPMFIVEFGYTLAVLPKDAAVAVLDALTQAEYVKREYDAAANAYRYRPTPPAECPEVIMRPLTLTQLAGLALSRDQA